ncbi:nucleotide exchange factor GrpE [Mycoplasma procyoni]|uniref:nucleotide exchange factor GrpE n=1 Tax=Mycoplasma procyoni TaxID=568784 RepID=UPI00197B81B1|nr:nucleotide exchange factor GrpE [Mycoplasma procyoni]MBN3534930.1 nucleotide exchange factor GrpE [Mycoplasma procyoni]
MEDNKEIKNSTTENVEKKSKPNHKYKKFDKSKFNNKNQTQNPNQTQTQTQTNKPEKKSKETSLIEKQKIKISLLELDVEKLKVQLEKNNEELKAKALELQQKAKEEIQKHKDENSSKLELEITNIKKYGLQRFFEDLIMPLRNFELAIQMGSKQENPSVQSYVKGFSMLFKQIEQILSEAGVTKIEPYVGEEFNSEIHQVYELEDNPEFKDKVIQVKNNGYKLYDRVIQPAVVVVGK